MNLCSHTPKPVDPRRTRLYDLYQRHGANKVLEYVVHNKHNIGLVELYRGPNYGNSISCYSLYFVLKSMGYEVLMIERIGRNYKDVCDQVTSFINENYFEYDLSSVFESWYALRALNERCDTFLVGSDQIWKAGLYIPHFYTLDSVDDNKRKIAYGVSFGHNHLRRGDFHVGKMSFFVKKMDSVGVREKSGVDICMDEFGAASKWVVDPVVLSGSVVLDKIAGQSDRSIDEKYVLSYMLEPNENKDDVIEHVSKLTG